MKIQIYFWRVILVLHFQISRSPVRILMLFQKLIWHLLIFWRSYLPHLFLLLFLTHLYFSFYALYPITKNYLNLLLFLKLVGVWLLPLLQNLPPSDSLTLAVIPKSPKLRKICALPKKARKIYLLTVFLTIPADLKNKEITLFLSANCNTPNI